MCFHLTVHCVCIMVMFMFLICSQKQSIEMRRETDIYSLKAPTHRPNRWTSEAFGETLTRSGTNMFRVFRCVGSFRSRADVVGSDSACEV